MTDIDDQIKSWREYRAYLLDMLEPLRRRLTPVWNEQRQLRYALRNTHHLTTDRELECSSLEHVDARTGVLGYKPREWTHDGRFIAACNPANVDARRPLFAELDRLAREYGKELEEHREASKLLKVAESELKRLQRKAATERRPRRPTELSSYA